MKRYVSLREISDGRTYTANDMVKADCADCVGCSSCCEHMADTIQLDPLDIFRLTTGLKCSFEQLLTDHIALGVVDGIVLPHMKISGEPCRCSFLTAEGRCSIHALRPGFCRLFPLGRYYENRSFSYFLQIHECPKPNRAKVKVRKWIDTPRFDTYEKFISDWHYFLKDIQDELQNRSSDAEADRKKQADAREISMRILQSFYLLPYESDIDFYEQFYERLTRF